MCNRNAMNDIEISAIPFRGSAPFFVFCDHAINTIPHDMRGLGMPEDILDTHIAWDIGAGELSIAIGRELDATVFACGFSRLIIDPNRAFDSKDLIPAVSDQIPVPGNQMLTEIERQRRIDQFHAPYHDQLEEALGAAMTAHEDLFVVSVHSFTHRLMGAAEDRPWEIGVLWREDEFSARVMIDFLRRCTDWEIGDNAPYDARAFNYSIDRHIGSRGLRHVTLEIRQDLLHDESVLHDIAKVLAEGVVETAAQEEPVRYKEG